MDGSALIDERGSAGSSRRGSLRVFKFGGSSLASEDRMRRVVDVVCAAWRRHRLLVVASAVGRTTDVLVEMLDAAVAGSSPEPFVHRIRDIHVGLARAVLADRLAAVFEETVDALLADAWLAGRAEHPCWRDRVLAIGERLSVPLLALALRQRGIPAVPVDAAPIVRTDETFGEAHVDEALTSALVRAWFSRLDADTVGVVTGFLGSSHLGRVTTLGRGGSDYSAALLARALDAEALERWTDVDGLYTSDPNVTRGAVRLASMALSEARMLNRAGKLGMHRKALDPVFDSAISVYVRSTLAPDDPGTVILPPGKARLPRMRAHRAGDGGRR